MARVTHRERIGSSPIGRMGSLDDGARGQLSGSETDSSAFRHAAGQFVTGVTVVTTLDQHDQPVGLTVNSFSSVSLDPPLVLFCLGNESDTNRAFDTGLGFVVNVLAHDQHELSRRFAATMPDRFDRVAWESGHKGMPILDDALSVFECDLFESRPAGDHRILVGEVVRVRFRESDRPALGYFRSAYISVSLDEEEREWL